MEVLTAKRFKDERIIAYGAIERLKDAAATLESNDPTHKNGVKFLISKKQLLYLCLLFNKLYNFVCTLYSFAT